MYNNAAFLQLCIKKYTIYFDVFWGRGELVAVYAHAYNELCKNTNVCLLIQKKFNREREREREREKKNERFSWSSCLSLMYYCMLLQK